MSVTLIDSNVLIDLLMGDATWYDWSSSAIKRAANESTLAINAIIYAEVSATFHTIKDLDYALPVAVYRREPLPYDAAFMAGRAYLKYRKSGGTRISPLPDFYIGAHATVAGFRLLTRDARRYRTYFPSVELIAP